MRSGILMFLGRRRALLVAAFLLAWVVGLDLVWLLPTRESLRGAASELSLQVAEGAGTNIRAVLEHNLMSVEDVAADIAENPARAQAALERLLRRNMLVRHAALIDKNGTPLVRAGMMEPGETEPDYSKMPGVYLALAGTSNFSQVEAEPDGTPISFVSVPAELHTARDVLVAEISLSSLRDDILTYKDSGWKLYVTDKDGNEIIGSEAGENVLSRPIVQKVVIDGQVANGLSPADSYKNSEGTQVFTVGIPIPIANWSLFVERPRSEALRGELIITWLALVIFVLGAFAIAVTMISYARLALQGAELREKNNRLQELDKMKSEFLSVAAHQLRTPLSALKWTLEAALAGVLEPEQRSMLMKGNESNERMIRLIDDMLAVTRIEAGKVRYTLVPLHIEDVVDNVLLDFISQARARHIALSFERPASALPYISADPERMHDIIGNLIENAIRYTGERGTITVRAEETADMVRVSVADTGIGIPPEQQSSIFSKFFRADNAAKIQTDGSGLGLFIVKAMVEQQGGKVWFESQLRKGTMFFFTIPVHKETNAEA